MLPGDVDTIGLDDLINHQMDALAPVLVYPHHGGLPGTSDVARFTLELSQLVSPATVIFSIERNRFSTPRPEIVATLVANLNGVRIMCTQLSEHCTGHLPQTTPTHLSDVYARGREGKQCCAGSVIIDPLLPDPLTPTYNSHQQFIDVAAPTALCRHRV